MQPKRAEMDDSKKETVLLSVVIPVYLAEKTLPELCSRLDKEFKKIPGKCEAILVEDGSPDQSWKVLEQQAAKYNFIKGIKLSRNFGQQNAITAGVDASQGEWTVIMDCDLQDSPEAISRLLDYAKSNNYDIVLVRRNKRKHGLIKRAISRLYYKCFQLLSSYETDPAVGAFRIMSRTVVDAFCNMRESHRFLCGLTQWLGFNVGHLDIEHQSRLEGKSTYTIHKLFNLAFDGLFSFSNRPLYLSITLGAIVSFAAFSTGIYFLIKHIFFQRVEVVGWTSLVLLISFFSGLILVNIGIVGVYIGKIYDQVKHRPLYVIDKTI